MVHNTGLLLRDGGRGEPYETCRSCLSQREHGWPSYTYSSEQIDLERQDNLNPTYVWTAEVNLPHVLQCIEMEL